MHGDPTLSNILFRPTSIGNQLLIGDPIPSRLCVPSNRAVDYGKLLQSCMGWEHVLNDEWAKPSHAVFHWMIGIIPGPIRAACLFWGAYHCARIAITGRQDKHRVWGKVASEQLVAEAAQCSMPTT